MSKVVNYKYELLHNLNNNIYAKLALFPSGNLGFVAIKDIPIGVNPFVLTNNQNIVYDFVKLSESDVKSLDISVRELIAPLFCNQTMSYYVPFYGINSMNFILYIQINKTNSNLTYDENDLSSELFKFKTTRPISKCEELIAPRFKFNIEKINTKSTDENDLRKRLVLKNLSETYCKIGPTTIPTITGSGVIAIKDIQPNTNPFMHTENACYFYNSVNLSNRTIKKLKNKEVKKIVRDFICPDENKKYAIPYLGFNSLNVSYYLNHSIIPNLSVMSDNCEYLGFRTNRLIRQGEELFINYNDYTDNFEELMKFQKSNYTCDFMIPK
jgi:hypothetical protein